MRIRAVIVDDEPLARKRLRRLLQEHPSIQIVGEAGDGGTAHQVIESMRPDLVFLDIQMPGLSGLEVVSRLEHRPEIIFVTAHDEFAVRAFEERALDYLLKPVEPDRLARAVARVERRPAGRAEEDPRVALLIEALSRARPEHQKIAVRHGPKILLVDVSRAVFFRAEDKYTVLYTADAEYVLDRTIDELERSLDPDTFVRIHRSVIININCVRDMTTIEGGRFAVALTDSRGSRVFASRSGVKLLRDRLKL
jgi:two-component system LytT family response regulator